MTEIKDSAARAKIEGLQSMVEQDRRDTLRQITELGSTVGKMGARVGLLEDGQQGVKRRLDTISEKMDGISEITNEINVAATSIRWMARALAALFGICVALAAAYTAFTGAAPFPVEMMITP